MSRLQAPFHVLAPRASEGLDKVDVSRIPHVRATCSPATAAIADGHADLFAVCGWLAGGENTDAGSEAAELGYLVSAQR